MSTFTVPVKCIRTIEPHLNADALEFAVIDGYRSIVRKETLQPGALVAYLPEGSLLPEWLLKRLDLWDADKERGKLNGKQGNLVKAIKLRGELSQGICYPLQKQDDERWLLEYEKNGASNNVAVVEGADVSDLLNISKYEPPIPVSMTGEVFNAGQHLTLQFDVENWKSYPDILQDGENVVFTEKLHGTCTVVAVLPYKDAHPEAFGEKKNILVFSKGLGAKGLVFKNNERNRDNLYVRATRSLIERIDELQRGNFKDRKEPLFILGETVGPKVQDLTYGKKVEFRVFAAASGYRGNQSYYDWWFVETDIKNSFKFETVPVLYRGPFSVDVMRKYTDGKTVMEANHLREGIVMVPLTERYHSAIGRVCLKSVSTDYLTRKNGTEFN